MPAIATLRSWEPSRFASPQSRLHPLGAGPQVTSTEFYSWACCVFDPFDFIYVYGLSADCDRLSRVHRGTTLHKGRIPSLVLGRDQAEAAAAQLREVYEDIGSVLAMPVRVFLREKYGLDLDRPEWMRGRH